MVTFPLKYEIKAESDADITTPWATSQNHLDPILCSIPTEFGGPGNIYTPESFFAMSILNCIIAMFKAYSAKFKIPFERISGNAIATMDKDASTQKLSITHLDITINVAGSNNKERSKEILESSIEDCPISRSIKTGKTFHINVN